MRIDHSLYNIIGKEAYEPQTLFAVYYFYRNVELILYVFLFCIVMHHRERYYVVKKACNRSRTGDLLLTRQVLYQLSYTGYPTKILFCLINRSYKTASIIPFHELYFLTFFLRSNSTKSKEFFQGPCSSSRTHMKRAASTQKLKKKRTSE